MDPLIELPEPAKLRIRARETEADEQYGIVVRACEGDVATAQSLWAGYIDLHQHPFRDANRQAQATIDEAKVLSAKYVFMAHAIEYRDVLGDVKDLEPVLARLREMVIQRYGGHVRAGVQSKEAQQMEKASAEWETKREVSVGGIRPNSPSNTTTEKSEGPAQAGRRQGRPRNKERREAIHNAIAKYGDEWRDRLSDIFTELDTKGVSLGDLQHRQVDLGDGQTIRASSWGDLDFTMGKQRKDIIDVLRKYAR